MNREIKFRAWDTTEKKMIAPGWWGVQSEDGRMFKNEANYSPFDGLEVVMQYTGLKDKKGKEIYEGDIVYSLNWHPTKYEVVFDRGGFCLKSGEDSNFYPDIKYAEDMEVLGNVYENPDLVKVEDNTIDDKSF